MKQDLKLKLLHAVFPNKCPACHKVVLYNELFCKECLDKFDRPKGERCQTCFSLKEKCDCKKHPKFHVKSAAPFLYKSAAKDSLITLKKLKHKRLARFFADNMARTIETEFKDVEFDAIIPVPLHKDKLKSRGYNQSELLAEEISLILNVPVKSGVLIQKDKAKSQHTLAYKERHSNVKGIYRAGGVPIECQRVLLIDDIMTSGATLNECAKMLRLEGVTKIYCITVAKTE